VQGRTRSGAHTSLTHQSPRHTNRPQNRQNLPPKNPPQSAAFYVDGSLAEAGAGGVATSVQHNGKEMSYNNYLDADAAYSACCDFTVRRAVAGACGGPVMRRARWGLWMCRVRVCRGGGGQGRRFALRRSNAHAIKHARHQTLQHHTPQTKPKQEPTCVIVKHTNPCGVASRGDLKEAYRLAVAADPISAFGGIVAFNRAVDADLAREIREFR
jgi:AICAR transformylase/IMP cyclohydrolase PurH